MRRLDQRLVSESVEEKWKLRLLRYGDRFSRACEATREKMHFANASDALQQPRFQQIPHSHIYVAVADACSHRAIAKQVSRGTRWLLVGVSNVFSRTKKRENTNRTVDNWQLMTLHVEK